MAAVEDEADYDGPYKDIDIETLLSRVQRRPLTFKKTFCLAPEFLQRLKGEETVNEGEDLTLSFKVVGTPRPKLRWFKDDEEVQDHPRLTVEEGADGQYRLTLHQVNKGDEAAYRCRAENPEGTCSCCFFLTVKGKPRSPKRDSKNCHKRTVSFPTMFSTIVEKVEEEEKAWKETRCAPASPLTHYYDSLTLKGRSSWPSFLGDWAFVNGSRKARGGSTGSSYSSTGSEGDIRNADDVITAFADDDDDDVIITAFPDQVNRDLADAESWQPDDVFLDSPETDGPAADVAQAADLVFLLQDAQQRTQRVRTVPANADLASAEVTSRGQAGSVSLKGSLSRQPDSRDVSSPAPRLGDQKGEERSASSVTCARTSSDGGLSQGQGAGCGSASPAYTACKPAASPPGKTASQHASSSPALSALPSSSSLLSSSSAASSSQPDSAASPPATSSTKRAEVKSGSGKKSSSALSGIGTAETARIPHTDSANKRAAGLSAQSTGPRADFSLSTDRITGKSGSGKPLSVRGPLGALISPSGDAGKKSVPARRSSPSKSASSSQGSDQSPPLTPPGLVTPGFPHGPTVTVSPAPCDTRPSSGCRRPQQMVDGKMCDCGNPNLHYCDCSSSSSSFSNAAGVCSCDCETSSAVPSSFSSGTSLSLGSSLCPSFPDPNSELLPPQYEREEREPTPIPPDRLIITHTPTGNSVLLQMYRGNLRPPVHPKPATLAKEKEVDGKGLPADSDVKIKFSSLPSQQQASLGTHSEDSNRGSPELPPMSTLKAATESPKQTNIPQPAIAIQLVLQEEELEYGNQMLEVAKRSPPKPEPLPSHSKEVKSAMKVIPKLAEELAVISAVETVVESFTGQGPKPEETKGQPLQATEKSNPPFIKRPGESTFTRPAVTSSSQQTSPSQTLVPKHSAVEALYFDPEHQDLIHVKPIYPGRNPPPRARSLHLELRRGFKKKAAREPNSSRRSSSPKAERPPRVVEQPQRPQSDSNVYNSITTDPEQDLVWQYLRELVFLLCLITFLALLFHIRPHIFVGVVLLVHLGLFLSRKYIFVRK